MSKLNTFVHFYLFLCDTIFYDKIYGIMSYKQTLLLHHFLLTKLCHIMSLYWNEN